MIACIIRTGSSLVLSIGLLFISCTNRMEVIKVDCSENGPTLTTETVTNPTGCDSKDGFISVLGSGGKAPYEFRLNEGAYQSFGTFSNLNGGTFIIDIRDGNGCGNSTSVSLSVASSDLNASATTEPDSECFSDNGKIAITASGSFVPLQFKLGSGAYGEASVFEGLKEGRYDISVKDNQNCSLTLAITVDHGQTGISYSADIKSIIATNCAVSGCHVAGSQSPDLSIFANIKKNADDIQTRTTNRSMPPDGTTLTPDEITKIACWVKDGAHDN